jgi:hypothetical protein
MLLAHGFNAEDIIWNSLDPRLEEKDRVRLQALLKCSPAPKKQTAGDPTSTKTPPLVELPKCKNKCLRFCFGHSAYCCSSCEQGGDICQKGSEEHDTECNKGSSPKWCCMHQYAYGGNFHEMPCNLCGARKAPNKLGKSLRRSANKRAKLRHQKENKKKSKKMVDAGGEKAEETAVDAGEKAETASQKRVSSSAGKGDASKAKKQRVEPLKAFYGTGYELSDAVGAFLPSGSLQAIAGNTMSPPVVGSLLLMALAGTRALSTKGDGKDDARENVYEHAAGYDSIFAEGLFERAGTPRFAWRFVLCISFHFCF